MADARPTRARGKDVNYKEPEGYSGLYKIRPDAPPASDSENDEDGAVPKSVSKKAKKAQPGAAKPPPPQRGPAVEKAQFSPGDSLFITIRDRPSAVPMAVSQWWQDYAFRRAFAVEQLANLVVEASGYRGMFPSECFKDEGAMDVDEQVGRLVDQLKDLPCEPHMRSADGKSVKLRKNLEEFWRKFVEMAPKENLVEICANPLCKWIFAMSTALLKEVRQSAVLAGLAMTVGLVSVGADIIQDMANKSRLQAAASSSKAAGSAPKEKIQRLQEEVRGLQAMKVQLEEQIDLMVNAIFMHRHRDTISTVRAQCIAALAHMVTLCQSKFLNNGFLKYIGWGLNDNQPAGGHIVRKASLDAIAQIYAMDPGKELDLFSDRFKDRIVAMRNDVDSKVQESAIHVSGLLAKRGLLNDEQTEALYSMIVDDDKDLRRAAAQLINDVYLQVDLEKAYADEDKKTNKSEYMLKGIVELLHQVAGDFEDMSPMCEVLGQECEGWGFRDWGLMVKTLQDDDDDALLEEQKETLARVLAAALRLAPEEASASSAPKGRKSVGDEDLSGVATVLQALPKLVSSLGLNAGVLCALLGVVENLPVSHDMSTRQAKSLGLAVDALSDAALKTQDIKVVRHAARALDTVCKVPPGVEALLEGNFASLAEAVCKQTTAGMQAIARGSKPSATAIMGIRRAAVINGMFDLGRWNRAFLREAQECAESTARNASTAPEAAFAAVALSHSALMWRMYSHMRTENEDAEEVAAARDALVDHWGTIALSEQPLFVRMAAVAAIGDAAALSDMGKGAEQVRRKGVVAMAKAAARLFEEESADSDEFEKTVCDLLGYDGACDGLDLYRDAAIRLNTALFKTHANGKADDEATSEIIATLHIGFEPMSDRDTTNWLAEGVRTAASQDDGKASQMMLGAHQKMYSKILDMVNAREDEKEASKALVSSVSNLNLSPHAATKYVSEGLKWSLSALPSIERLGFLDIVGLATSKLPAEEAARLLNVLEDTCKSKKVSLKDASGPFGFISRLRHKLVEAADGGSTWAVTKTGGKSPATPASRGGRASHGTPLSAGPGGRLFSQGDEEMSQEIGSAKSSQKKRGSGGKKKKKRASMDSDKSEEDEEGFKSTRSSRA